MHQLIEGTYKTPFVELALFNFQCKLKTFKQNH